MNPIFRPFRRTTRGPLTRTLSVAGAGLLAAAWLAFAPTTLGGSSTYVTTYGTSMEPTLHRGDLAVVRAQSSYRVGEIVAYRSALLNTIVLHRIIERDGEHYVFKGDNNPAADSDRPTADALVGQMTTRLPGLGTQVQRATSPPVIAGMAMLGFFPLAKRCRRRARHAIGAGTAAPRAPRRRPVWAHVDPRLLIGTAVGLGLLAVTFTKPESIAVTRDLPFDDRGEFSYSGAAPDGLAVYQEPRVSSGQPVFLNLVEHLEISFAYQASSTSSVDSSGDLSLHATIKDGSGWTYPIDLAAPTHFPTNEARISGTLDLRALQTTIADAQLATGVSRDAYTVVIEAVVAREIRHVNALATGTFTADLEFRLDDHELSLVALGPDALAPSQGGLLTIPSRQVNGLKVLGHSLSIAMARAAALGIAVVIAGLWADCIIRMARGDEHGLIERRYRSYLLPASVAEHEAGSVIDVDSMADLARMADHLGAPILRGDLGTYGVIEGERTYRYSGATPTTLSGET